MPENTEESVQTQQESEDIFNFDEDSEKEDINEQGEEIEDESPPTESLKDEDEYQDPEIDELRKREESKALLTELVRRKAKRKGKNKVVDLLSDDDPEETPPLYLEATDDDRTAHLVQFFDTMDYEDHKDWSVKVIRKEPEEIKGEFAVGFLESFAFPKSYFDLQQKILRKYGGGVYRLVITDSNDKLKRVKHITLPGNAIQKKNIIEEEEEDKLGRHNSMESQEMQRLQQELYEIKAYKMADDARREATQNYEKLAERGNSDMTELLKAMILANSSKNNNNESNPMIEELKRQNEMLMRKLETQESSSQSVEMFKAFATMMAAMRPETPKSELDKLLPIVLGTITKEDPTKTMLLQNALDPKKNNTEDMLLKLMDIPVNMMKKMSDLKMESLTTGSSPEESGDITPKDLLMTGANVFENIFERMYSGQGVSQEQLALMQQQGVMPTAHPVQQPQHYPPQVVGPQPQMQYAPQAQQQDPQGQAVQGQVQQPQPQQEEMEVEMFELSPEMRERVKGSIEGGASGENFGKLILENVPLGDWKPTIEQLSIDDIFGLLSSMLTPMVGEELSKILTETENGQKYGKEAIQFIKANI